MLGSLDEADGVAPVIPITFPVRLVQRRAAADPALLVPSGVVMLDPRVLTVDVGVSRFRDPDELVIRESVPVGIEHRVAEINAPAPLFDITSSDQRMGGVVRQGRDRIDRTHDADSRIRHRSDGRFEPMVHKHDVIGSEEQPGLVRLAISGVDARGVSRRPAVEEQLRFGPSHRFDRRGVIPFHDKIDRDGAIGAGVGIVEQSLHAIGAPESGDQNRGHVHQLREAPRTPRELSPRYALPPIPSGIGPPRSLGRGGWCGWPCPSRSGDPAFTTSTSGSP